MILGFSTVIHGEPTNFVEKILSGEKTHTVRLDPKRRWRPGMKIHFATGVRTKNYRQFHAAECLAVQSIVINLVDVGGVFLPRVIVDNVVLSHTSKQEFLRRDGLNDFSYFVNKKHPNFSGRLIHWAGAKY